MFLSYKNQDLTYLVGYANLKHCEILSARLIFYLLHWVQRLANGPNERELRGERDLLCIVEKAVSCCFIYTTGIFVSPIYLQMSNTQN